MRERTEFYVHHPAMEPVSHDKCDDQVRQIQRLHIAKDWDDIGYNDLVCSHGEHFEGRGSGFTGAHCPGHNRSAVGICVLVNGDNPVPQKALAKVRELYDIYSWSAGRLLLQRGHRDGKQTHCPGDWLYDWVRSGMIVNASEAIKPSHTSPITSYNIDMVHAIGGPNGGAWVLTRDGAVYSFNEKFYGNYWTIPEQHRNRPDREFKRLERSKDGIAYVLVSNFDEYYDPREA